MKKLMLGFAGEIAAGKGTATDLVKLRYPGTRSVRFSDSLREFLVGFNEMKWKSRFAMVLGEVLVGIYVKEALPKVFSRKVVEQSGEEKQRMLVGWLTKEWFSYPEPVKEDRHNLQALSTAVRSILAENILERTVVARIGRIRTKSPVAIIEGIRRLVDISTLLTEPNFRLVYIDIDPEIAFERMKKRNENIGDSDMTRERFMELCGAEAEQQIRLLKPRAHLVIDNSGAPEVLENILEREVTKWSTP